MSPIFSRPLFFLLALFLIWAARGSAEEFATARALALQGGHASPADNGTLFLNPAGVALYPRYDLTTSGRAAEPGRARDLGVSIVDSVTQSPVGGGIGWFRRAGGRRPADDWALALAQRYGSGSALGLAYHYRMDRERSGRLSDMNLDVGFIVDELGGHAKVSLAGYNLFNPPQGIHDVHRRYVLGIASRWFDVFELMASGGYNPGFAKGARFDTSLGAEVFLPYVSLRGSYGQFPSGPLRSERWAAGLSGGEPGAWKIGYVYASAVRASPAYHGVDVTIEFRP